MIEPKPWWAGRWETVEPEEDFGASFDNDYNDPTDSELLDYEERINTFI